MIRSVLTAISKVLNILSWPMQKGIEKRYPMGSDPQVWDPHWTEGTVKIRTYSKVSALVLTSFIIWASFANIEELTRGEGKVVSSSQLQIVQSLDGGIIEKIYIKPGQTVEKGQALLQIDATRFQSGAKEGAMNQLSLQARAARLRALAEDGPLNMPVEIQTQSPKIAFEEQRLYESKLQELRSQLAVHEQTRRQRMEEIEEARAKKSAAEKGLLLAQQELTATRPLLKEGAVSEVEVLRVQKDVTRAQGEKEQANAQLARAQASVQEVNQKMSEVTVAFRNEARKDLADTQAKLAGLQETQVALDDKVQKSEVKSPMRGVVQRLMANTIGGVVQPGKDIVEIVPLNDTLVVEAKVSPKDIAFLSPGQPATIKLTAYDYSIYGGLDGVVQNISPDAVTDEKGNTYYVVRVQTDVQKIAERSIIPGMTASVDIKTGKKTVLSYILKPLIKGKTYAFTEK